ITPVSCPASLARARNPVRSLAQCRAHPGSPAPLSRHGGVDVRINLKDLLEPRYLEDWFYIFLQAREREFTAILFDLLHRLNQHREAGTIDIADVAHVDVQIA